VSKYQVPVGELKAAREATAGLVSDIQLLTILSESKRWQAKNPVVPTDDFLREMLNRDFFSGENWTDSQVFAFCVEWQRRMYLSPEVPENIKDLLYDPKDGPTKVSRNDAIIEAYRRGRQEGR